MGWIAGQPEKTQITRRRVALRARAKIYLLIRERLEVMGIDSRIAAALRLGNEAVAELAAIPDTPGVRDS